MRDTGVLENADLRNCEGLDKSNAQVICAQFLTVNKKDDDYGKKR